MLKRSPDCKLDSVVTFSVRPGERTDRHDEMLPHYRRNDGYYYILLSNGPKLYSGSGDTRALNRIAGLCLRDCREKFGYLPYWGGGGRGGANEETEIGVLYFKFINEKFWKQTRKKYTMNSGNE